MHLIKKEKIKDKYIWFCSQPCKTEVSVRQNSVFDGIKVGFSQYLKFLVRWCDDNLQRTMVNECEVSRATITKWCYNLRGVVQEILLETGGMIGGIDENGVSKVVEIDESLFFRRKYNRGRLREGQWVFGGIDRQTGECFLVPVPDRRAVTLLTIINMRILPGTTIISDCWAAYRSISEINDYTHNTVNHTYNFVDPLDSSIHTQNIENCWLHAKRPLRRQFGTSERFLEGYLQEFMFKRKFKVEKRINNLIINLNFLKYTD
jgi:transposase-like protein